MDRAPVRRALAGDSTVELDTRVRDSGGGWHALERGRTGPLAASDLSMAAARLDRMAETFDGFSTVIGAATSSTWTVSLPSPRFAAMSAEYLAIRIR